MAFAKHPVLDLEAGRGTKFDETAQSTHDGYDFMYNEQPRLLPRFRSTQKRHLSRARPQSTLADDLVLPGGREPQGDVKAKQRSFFGPFNRTLQRCWLLFFFRLPALYQSRVRQIGTDSGISGVDINTMSSTFSALWKHELQRTHGLGLDVEHAITVSPALMQFKPAWEVVVDDFLQEWKTFNIIAALLQTSNPVLLTLDNSAGSDPVTRTAVLISFICSGISLLCGSFCLLRFGSMRKMPKAAVWMREAQKDDQLMWWNCWIMLAMPATWLAWSVILFFTAVMTYTWRTAFNDSFLTSHTTLSLRIAVSSILGFGIVCIMALALTLSSRFGDSLDHKFKARVALRSRTQARTPPPDEQLETVPEKAEPFVSFPVLASQSYAELPPAPAVSHHAAFPTTKLIDAKFTPPLSPLLPREVSYQNQKFQPWDAFRNDLQVAFKHPASRSEDTAFDYIRGWNDTVFKPNGIEAILCLEFPLNSDAPPREQKPALEEDGIFAVYVMDIAQARADGRHKLVDIFGPLPNHLLKVCLVDAIQPSVSRQRGYPLGLLLEREAVPVHTQEVKAPDLVDQEVTVSNPEDLSKSQTQKGKQKEGKADSDLATAERSPRSLQSPGAGPSSSSSSRTSSSRHQPTTQTPGHSTTRLDPGRQGQGKRTKSAPQVVVNSRQNRTSNATVDSRSRTKRTDSSQQQQKIRRR